VEYVGLARQLWQRVEAEHQVIKSAQEHLIATLEALEPRRGSSAKYDPRCVGLRRSGARCR
jgi:hypothetical protein